MTKVKLSVYVLFLALYMTSCSSLSGNRAVDSASFKPEDKEEAGNSAVDKPGPEFPGSDREKNGIAGKAGYKEVSALIKGYPGIVSDLNEEEDEITFRVNGRKFYFAGGRLLPEEKKDKAEYYRSYGFYDYPDKMPPLEEPSDEELEKINSFISERSTVSRDNTFLEEVYNGHSFNEILEEMRYINFLEFRFEVHRSLISRFKAVEKEILSEAAKDPELSSFISSLSEAGSFNWRIANGSRSRSYHSYGIAVDFSPETFGRQQVFWDWSRKFYKKWYMIPYSRRWMVNEKFVSAFEKQGFVWGGKWFYYDNMHFEYRPEILILSAQDN